LPKVFLSFGDVGHQVGLFERELDPFVPRLCPLRSRTSNSSPQQDENQETRGLLLVAIAMDTDPAGFLEDAEITNFHDGT
jgi:hypothetical protein